MVLQKQKLGWGWLVLVLLAMGQITYAQTPEDLAPLRQTSRAFTAIADKSIPAVVNVKVAKKVERQPQDFEFMEPFGDDFMERFFGPGQRPRSRDRGERRQRPREFTQQGQGSGFIISPDGIILTNNHVVGDVDEITVTLNDGREFKAVLKGTDEKTDVAVIQIKDKAFDPEKDKLPNLPLGDSDKIQIGEWVVAIGSPFGLTSTLTVGVVSAKGRNVGMGVKDGYENFIQTDAAINPGNSGGPLLNLDGEVIGINTAIISRSGGYMGVGFAVPINMAKYVEEQLLTHGKVTRGQLGVKIEPVDQDMAKALDLNSVHGVVVQTVLEDSAAEKAGIKNGDVIIELNGKKFESMQDFRNTIAMTPPGSKVELTLIRNGEHKKVEVMIGELSDKGVAQTPEQTAQSDKLGLEVETLNRDHADTYGFTEKDKGVIIIGVDQGSVAEMKGLKPGQLIFSVNHQTIKTVEDFNTAVAENTRNDTVLLMVKDRSGERMVALRLKTQDEKK